MSGLAQEKRLVITGALGSIVRLPALCGSLMARHITTSNWSELNALASWQRTNHSTILLVAKHGGAGSPAADWNDTLPRNSER